MRGGVWLRNIDTGQPEFVYFDDMDDALLAAASRPIGGFCYSGHVFMELQLPEVPYYVKDWLPKNGRLLIWGPAKVGKSQLALQLARCIANQQPFLGIPTQRARVLYLQFELSHAALQDRMRATGQDYDNVFIGTTFDLKLDAHRGQEDLHKAMDAVRPQVLILDPLYRTLHGDEDKSKDLGVVIDVLDQLITIYDCSIVLVHHSGKDPLRGSRGSSVLEDYPDSVIGMRNKTGADKILRSSLVPQYLRHSALPLEPLLCKLEGGEFVTTQQEAQNHTLLTAVTKLARGKETVTMHDFVGLGSKSALYRALDTLAQTGVIARKGRGIYAIQEGGPHGD